MHTKIKGFPNYSIHADGSVFNEELKILKKPAVIRGYYYVDLYYRGKRRNMRLGRLVAQHFVENPNNLPQINHIDGNRLNDKMTNLEWVTAKENAIHRVKTYKEKGLYKSPRGNIKFSDEDIAKVRSLRKDGNLHREIAEEMKMGVSTVTHILLGSRR